jgi:predicted nucleic acid-binding protein
VIVIDASILANAIIDSSAIGQRTRDVLTGQDSICAPDCIDVETYSVFRKMWLRKMLSDDDFLSSIRILNNLPLQRYKSRHLLSRAYTHRHNVGAYDAAYVALAEELQCAFLTADIRLSTAPDLNCEVLVVA